MDCDSRQDLLATDEWRPIDPALRVVTYAEYAWDRSDPTNYMPRWADEECPGYQMYEELSDGTPYRPCVVRQRNWHDG